MPNAANEIVQHETEPELIQRKNAIYFRNCRYLFLAGIGIFTCGRMLHWFSIGSTHFVAISHAVLVFDLSGFFIALIPFAITDAIGRCRICGSHQDWFRCISWNRLFWAQCPRCNVQIQASQGRID
jgi:hypothetical protein